MFVTGVNMIVSPQIVDSGDDIDDGNDDDDYDYDIGDENCDCDDHNHNDDGDWLLRTHLFNLAFT